VGNSPCRPPSGLPPRFILLIARKPRQAAPEAICHPPAVDIDIKNNETRRVIPLRASWFFNVTFWRQIIVDDPVSLCVSVDTIIRIRVRLILFGGDLRQRGIRGCPWRECRLRSESPGRSGCFRISSSGNAAYRRAGRYE
jgi:hypothetical protein